MYIAEKVESFLRLSMADVKSVIFLIAFWIPMVLTGSIFYNWVKKHRMKLEKMYLLHLF